MPTHKPLLTISLVNANEKENKMLTRREFVEGAVAISGAALSGVGLAAHVNPKPRLDHLIYNARFAHAEQFAKRLIAYGVQDANIGDHDLGVMWFGQLRASCVNAVQCKNKVSLVGMGAHTEFFVMQSLAREVGLATRFCAEHRREQGMWQHQIKQNDWVDNKINLAAKESWAQGLADVLSQRTEVSVSSTLGQSLLMNTHEPRLLVSWVLG
jgi:hypothetical protein